VINASLMVGDVADPAAWAREMARVLVAGGYSHVVRLRSTGRRA
jgi:hypothetical protein